MSLRQIPNMHKKAIKDLLAQARDFILAPQSLQIRTLKKLITEHFEPETALALLQLCPSLKTLHIFTFIQKHSIIKQLFKFQHLDELKIFLSTDVTKEGIAEIVKLKNLKILGLKSVSLDDEDIEKVSKGLQNLKTFVLCDGKYTASSIKSLKKMKNLISLTFDNVALIDEVLIAIQEQMTHLQEFVLYNCKISEPLIIILFQRLVNLRGIKLWRCNQITEPTFTKILTAFPNLTDLDLSENKKLTIQQMELVGKMRSLKFLELYQCSLKAQKFQALSKAITFNLEHFFYDNNEKISKGVQNFILTQTNLKNLSLVECGITDDHVMLMGQTLKNLQYVVLSTNSISNKGYIYLFKLKLRRIHLRRNLITRKMVWKHFMNSNIFEFVMPRLSKQVMSRKQLMENQCCLGTRRMIE